MLLRSNHQYSENLKIFRVFSGFGIELEIILNIAPRLSVFQKTAIITLFFNRYGRQGNLIIVLCEKKGGKINDRTRTVW